MLTKILNAQVYHIDNIINADIVIKDNRIVSIGENCQEQKFDKVIDACGNLVIPSFKNAHAHSPMVFLRSYADDLPLQEWLFDKVFPNEAKLCADDCYWLTKLAILEYLSGGISVASDMYFYLDAIADACVDSGFRNVIMEGITQSNNEGLFDKLDSGKKKLDKMGGLIEYRLGLHAEYTNQLSNIELMSKYANQSKMKVYTHCAETQREVDDCVARYGVTPIKLLSDVGMFDNGGCLYHCVYPSQDDLMIIKQKNVGVVSCPASNLKLASGIAPLEQMRNMGINLALGTDGAASNNCLDMFREMFLATGLQKATTKNAVAMPANVVFDMATKGGANVMGLDDLDCLAEGKLADLVIIDLNQPNMQPINNPIKNIVYSASKSNVLLTMVNGKVLYEKGNYHIGEDIDRIYSKCQKIIQRIINNG